MASSDGPPPKKAKIGGDAGKQFLLSTDERITGKHRKNARNTVLIRQYLHFICCDI